MNAKELKRNKAYYYTQAVEMVEVTYMHETINGYKFKAGEVENELSQLQVERYIEEK